MRKNFGSKTFMYPMPVLLIAAYDENGQANVMNAAWGGIHDDKQIGICLSEGHKTTQNIFLKKEFTVSFADEKHVVEADFVGIVSGNDDPDKTKKTGFHFSKAEFTDAPVIDDIPMTLECKLVSYDKESGYMVADIVNVSAEESVLTDGKVDPYKLRPIIFDTINMNYLGIGEKVGKAFSDGKKLK